jgi:hypothetical protein
MAAENSGSSTKAVSVLKWVLATATVVALFGYHLVLDYHYRLNSDEFACMSYASQGIPGFGYALRFYLEREGNFLCMIIQGLAMRALAVGVPPYLILFGLKLTLWASVLFAVRTVFQVLGRGMDAAVSVFAASVIMITLYLITSNRPEIWHWAMGSVVYLVPQALVLLAASFMLQKKWAWAMVPLALLMHSRATYAVLFYGAVTLIMALLYHRYKERGWRFATMNLILLVVLLIYVFAPGNTNRLSEESVSTGFMLNQFKRDLTNIFVSFNLAKTDRLALGLLALVPLLPILQIRPRGAQWLLPGLLYVAFVLAHSVVFVAATGYAAWTRVLSMHSLLFLVTATFYAYFLYSGLKNSPRRNLLLATTATALLIAYFFKDFPSDLQKGRTFSTAYDRQWDRIFSYQGTASDTLFLEPLPDSGPLCYFQFSEDPAYWINSDFREAYGIEFEIALKVDGDGKTD